MKKSSAVKFLEHNLDILRIKGSLPSYLLAQELMHVLEELGMRPPEYIEKNANTTTSGWEEEYTP